MRSKHPAVSMIIFTSDQGYCYHRAKATAYDLGVHVPLIIAGPGLSRGLAGDELVSHVDLAPTILDLLFSICWACQYRVRSRACRCALCLKVEIRRHGAL